MFYALHICYLNPLKAACPRQSFSVSGAAVNTFSLQTAVSPVFPFT